jgi:hypothetical protein
MEGYAHPLYARSLAEFGRPIELPQSGGWLLERSIPASNFNDAIGCYPLFCCSDWSGLESDIHRLAGQFVTVSIVLDPFAPVEPDELRGLFDVVNPFKDHFVVSLEQPPEQHVAKHHRYYARKALQSVTVATVSDPGDWLQVWRELYGILIQREGLIGIKAFSLDSFRLQLQIPGLVMFLATQMGKVVGAHLWYLQGEVAYSHLAAYNDQGYSAMASYALYWTAIRTFKEEYAARVRWLDLGAGAGVSKDETDGLSWFKRGWSNSRRRKYFCGKILNQREYDRLSSGRVTSDAAYFPSYRSGEFG